MGSDLLASTGISNAAFRRVLGLSNDALRTRVADGWLALAFGCPVNPFYAVFLSLDVCSMTLCESFQKQGVALETGAPIVRLGWRTWFPLLTETENQFRPGETLPESAHWWFAAATSPGCGPVFAGGRGRAKVEAALVELTREKCGEWALTRAVSLSAVLQRVHEREHETGVTLPRTIPGRFTVPPGYPAFDRFFEMATIYRNAAEMRVRLRARASPNAARALRELELA